MVLTFSLVAASVEAQTADSEIQPAPTSLPSAEQKSMELLAKFQDPAMVLWLEADGEKFLSLYRQALNGHAKGTVLLLHAEGQHPDWPGALSYLRNRLPELGWNTLSISLPDPKLAAVTTTMEESPSRPPEVLEETQEIFDPSTDSVSDGSLIPNPGSKKSALSDNPTEAKAVERIVAAVDYIKQQNNPAIILYGQGVGALRASRYWQETGDNAIKSLIFVDAQNGLPHSDFQLSKALNNPKMPVLDIVHSRAIDAELGGKQRAEHAAMMGLQAYQQHWFAEDNERLANMVYGFLRRNVSH